ncbi:MAG: restriction endonuclease subunit S, partial [Fibrobacterota bacterium]
RYIQRGKGPKYADQGRVRVVSQKCVQWTGFDLSPARWIEDRSMDGYGPERFLQPADLLWNSTGTGTAGRIAIYPGFEEAAVADSHVTVIRPARAIASRYLWCLIASPGVQARIDPGHERSIVSGTTNQVELSTSTVRSLPVPLPPLAEQKRIVAKVDELMALCDKLEALQNQRKAARAVLTKEILGRVASDATVDAQTCLKNLSLLASDVDQIPVLRQTILSLAVQGKLVPQVPGDGVELNSPLFSGQPFPLPTHWKWKEYGAVANISGGFAFKSSDYAPEGVFVLRVTNIEPSGRINKNEAVYLRAEALTPEIERFYLNEADLLLVMVGGSLGKLGVVSKEVLPALLNQNLWRITPHRENVHHRYLKLMTEYSLASNRHKTLSTHGHLSREEFRKRIVAVPPLAEQKQIVAKVDELMALCDTLEAKLRKASQVQEQLAISSIAALTGIQSQEKEIMKAPKTELVARLKIGKKPTTKDQAPLAALLVRHNGELDPKVLWQHSGMERIDDFYHQLKFEMTQGWIVQPEVPSMRVVGGR